MVDYRKMLEDQKGEYNAKIEKIARDQKEIELQAIKHREEEIKILEDSVMSELQLAKRDIEFNGSVCEIETIVLGGMSKRISGQAISFEYRGERRGHGVSPPGSTSVYFRIEDDKVNPTCIALFCHSEKAGGLSLIAKRPLSEASLLAQEGVKESIRRYFEWRGREA